MVIYDTETALHSPGRKKLKSPPSEKYAKRIDFERSEKSEQQFNSSANHISDATNCSEPTYPKYDKRKVGLKEGEKADNARSDLNEEEKTDNLELALANFKEGVNADLTVSSKEGVKADLKANFNEEINVDLKVISKEEAKADLKGPKVVEQRPMKNPFVKKNIEVPVSSGKRFLNLPIKNGGVFLFLY